MPSKKWLGALVALMFTVPLVTFLGWHWIDKRHASTAVLVAVVIDIALALAALVGKAAAVPINRRLAQLADMIDRALGQRMSRYSMEYRQWVSDSCRFMDAKGLATVGDFTPELDEVFVDMSLAGGAPHTASAGILSELPKATSRQHSIWDFICQREPVVLAVIGAPGSGKTTLLSHIARQVASAADDGGRTIPVLLPLRDHAAAIVHQPRMDLPTLLRDTVPALHTPEPAGWWEAQLDRGKCVVLLDGLDEVANAEDRQAATAWIDRQIALYPRNDYVVTSRPHGYLSSVIKSARALQIRAFTVEQVTKFLHAWYLAVERRATGSDGHEVDKRAQVAADDLLDRLAATPALYALTINPLLLTMIANVHRYRGSLPGSRADLYGEVCEVMLWRRQEAKRLPMDLLGASKERILARVAYQMMRRRAQDVPGQELLDSLREPLRRTATNVSPEQFLADVGSNGNTR